MENIATETTTTVPAPAPVKPVKKARKAVKARAKATVSAKPVAAKKAKKTKLRLIAEYTHLRWVPRKEICKKFGIVDNTARHYIGRLAHTKGYDVEYRKNDDNHGEYRTLKLAATK